MLNKMLSKKFMEDAARDWAASGHATFESAIEYFCRALHRAEVVCIVPPAVAAIEQDEGADLV